MFASMRPGGLGALDLYIASRASLEDAFSEPVNISELNSDYVQYTPSLSADGLTIYYCQRESWAVPGSEIWTATRPDIYSPFENAHAVDELNLPGVNVHGPQLSVDETLIYFGAVNRPGADQGVFWAANVIPEPGTFAICIPCIGTILLFLRKGK